MGLKDYVLYTLGGLYLLDDRLVLARSGPPSAAVDPSNLGPLTLMLLFLIGMAGYLYWCARRGWLWFNWGVNGIERVQRNESPTKFRIIMVGGVLFVLVMGSATLYNLLRLCRAGVCDLTSTISNVRFLALFLLLAIGCLCIVIQDFLWRKDET